MYEFAAKVTAVRVETLGSETTSALLAADTVIPVLDSGDFDESGGSVLIDGEVYTYSELDEGDETGVPSITLDAPGLTGAVAAETRVDSYNPSTAAVEVEWVADVIEEGTDVDGGAGEATIDHALIPLVGSGMPLDVGSSVTVRDDGNGEWTVINIRGETPVINLSYADPTTIPNQAATEIPTSPAIVSATGMPNTILLRTEEIDAPTLVTFQVSTDGVSWSALNTTPIHSTLFTARGLPDGTPFAEDVVYQFRTLAENNIGPAASESAAVTGQIDTSIVDSVARRVTAEEVHAGFGLFGEVNVGSDDFTLSPAGANSAHPEGGLRIVKSNGDLTHLTADDSPNLFGGNGVFDEVEVNESLRLSGETTVFGTVTFADSDIPDPTVAPTVTTYYSDEQLPVSNPAGLAVGLGGADWAVTAAGQVVTITSGAVTAARAVSNPVGITTIGASYYVLQRGVRELYVHKMSSALASEDFDTVVTIVDRFDKDRLAIGTDGTNVIIAHEAVDDDGVYSGDVVMTRYNPTTWAVVDTLTVPSVDAIGGVSYSNAGGEFAANRWILHPRNSDVKVYSTAGVNQPGDEWPRPYGKPVRGMVDSFGNNFYVIDNAGVRRVLASALDAPGATYWWSYAWVDSDTHTTLCSPEVSHVRPKRAQVFAIFPTAPQENAAGTHVANRIEVFLATSSGGTKNSQGVFPAGTKASPFLDVDTGSGGAPGSNNWATVSPPAELFTHDGDIGTGTYAASARTYALAGLDADLTTIAGLTPSNDDVIQRKSGAWTNRTMAQVKTDLALVKGDVGLGNVDNTSDVNKPVSTATQTALDLKAPASRTVNAQTGTTYTLALADANGFITFNNAGAIALTVPTNATVAFPTGTRIDIQQINSGAVTISGAGITFRSKGGLLTTNGVNAVVSLCNVGTNTWSVWGDRV